MTRKNRSRQQSQPNIVVTTIIFALVTTIIMAAIYNFTSLFTKATGTPANINIDASILKSEFNSDYYHAFSQGGEEIADMVSPVSTQLKLLKPKYIRIDHIYDYYQVVERQNGRLIYDFSKLDKIVDAITGIGATPVLSLSYMPQAIAIEGNIINPPVSWLDWADVVRITVEHFSGIGNKNLKNVYYEVWNEPDLGSFGSWKTYGNKNYLELYKWSATGVNSAKNVNNFLLGGPATTGLYRSWIDALIDSGLRLDFISWHTYKENPGDYYTEMLNIRSWLIRDPKKINIPLLITEFGLTGDKDRRYGTAIAAAHTAAVVSRLTNGTIKLFSFEIKDGPNDSNQGWGIFGHQNQGLTKKPRFYVYDFLDQMQGTLLGITGMGSWVTAFATAQNGNYKALLVNYDPQGTHTETVPVTFNNLPPAAYTVKTRYLWQSGCSRNVNSAGLIEISGNYQTQVCLSASNIALVELKSN